LAIVACTAAASLIAADQIDAIPTSAFVGLGTWIANVFFQLEAKSRATILAGFVVTGRANDYGVIAQRHGVAE